MESNSDFLKGIIWFKQEHLGSLLLWFFRPFTCHSKRYKRPTNPQRLRPKMAQDIIPKRNSLCFYCFNSLSQSLHQNFLQKNRNRKTETFFTDEHSVFNKNRKFFYFLTIIRRLNKGPFLQETACLRLVLCISI